MNLNDIYIGSHVSLKSPDYFLGSVEEAFSYGANTFMFYTGAPQNALRLPLEKLKIEEGKALLKEKGINLSKLVVHAPYIINLANAKSPDLYEFSKRTLQNEMKRTAAFGASILVLHPGSHVGQGLECALSNLVRALNDIINNDHSNVRIALETMAGKGTEIGKQLEELKYVIDHIEQKERIGVCLDTCHLFDAGYDIADIDEFLSLFDRIIGLNKILVLHINDSKNPAGLKKDRHQNIGEGFIGLDVLRSYVWHPLLKDIPKILETPYIDGNPPYKKEIAMLLNKNI